MPVTISGSTGITTPDGSAGTPAVKGTTSATAGLTFPAANTVAISTNSTEALRVDSSQNVGIGTASPVGKLGVVNSGGNSQISVGDTATSTYSTVRMYGGSGRYNFQLGVQNNVSNAFEITPSTAAGGTTFSTPAFVLDSSGNVGIGTSSPAFLLDVNKSQNTSTAFQSKNDNAGASATADVIINNGTTYAFLRQFGTGTGGFANQTWLSTTSANPLIFGTNTTERARIDSSGNLLVGTTSSSETVFGARLYGNDGRISSTKPESTNAASTFVVYSTGASAYRFYVGMGGTVFATNTTISGISDQRFKENVRDLDIGLDAVIALKPRKFDWKEGKGKDIKGDRGFIAQEFEQVFPDLIDEWKDESPEGEAPYKSVRQDLIPVLVKAIQELKAQNDELKARVEALEAK